MRQWNGKEWSWDREVKHRRKETLGTNVLQIKEPNCIFMVNKRGYIMNCVC
jgi:hypothetical protein